MDSLRQSKIRTRAIAITDIAIEKVPKIGFKGFTDKESEIIQNLHKSLLRIVQKKCKQSKINDYEYGIAIEIHSWKSIVIEGERGAVYLNKSPEAKSMIRNGYRNSVLYMHNHPSTGTFSADDIKTFLANESIFLMTAVGHDGSVYYIQKTYEVNVSQFMMDYALLAEEYKKSGYTNNNATLAIKDMLKQGEKYGLIYGKGVNKNGRHGKGNL